jgi:hypothetical protein
MSIECRLTDPLPGETALFTVPSTPYMLRMIRAPQTRSITRFHVPILIVASHSVLLPRSENLSVATANNPDPDPDVGRRTRVAGARLVKDPIWVRSACY